MPATGCVRPHHSWPTPNARLMLARPRPVVRVDDAEEQAHRLARAHRHREGAAGGEQHQPERRAGARRARSAGDSAIVGSSASVERRRRQSSSSACRRDDARLAEPRVEGELGALPGALRLGALGAAGVGGADERGCARRRRARSRPSRARPAAAGCASASRRPSPSRAASSPGRIGPSWTTYDSSEYWVRLQPGARDVGVVVPRSRGASAGAA